MLRPLLAAALVLAAGLAGCASEPEGASAAAATDPVVVTSPTDFGAINASSMADAPHLHDYWGGAETLVVMDGAYGFGTFVFSDYRAFDMRPEAGDVVPQGTEHVEVTISWTDAAYARYTQPELWVKTAEDNEPWLVGPLVPGEPLTITSTNDRNDLPHQALSAWVFQVRMHPGDDPSGLIWWNGDFEIQVRAHRGLEIPLYPAHPDPWQGRTEIPLLEHAEELFFAYGNPDEGNACLFGCLDILVPEDGAVVPWNASFVEVVLTMGDDSATQLGLSFHGAESRAFTRIDPDSVEGKTRTYVIPIMEGMGDGPYAKQSQWEFRVYPDEPVENEAHLGSYTLTARVVK